MSNVIAKPKGFRPLERRHPLAPAVDCFYTFTENYGDVIRDSAGMVPLQDLLAQIAAPAWRTTKWGPGLDFDGTNDELGIAGTSGAGTPLDYMGQFTLIVFAEFDTFATNTRTLICRRTSAGNFQWQFRSNTSSRLELLCGGGTIAPTGYTLNTGQGYICGVTRGPVNTTIYVDGISVGAATNASLTHRNVNVSIGNAFGISAALNGAISGVLMAHRAFSEREMKMFAADPWGLVTAHRRTWLFRPQAVNTQPPRTFHQFQMRRAA